MDTEIETHISLRTDELVARGMSREAAHSEAIRRFGDPEQARRALRSADRAGRWPRRFRLAGDALGADVRLALRRARRAPGFTLLAVVIFALGVGATTSMFTLADHVLVRPLPQHEPDRLVALWSVAEGGGDFPWVSMSNWVDWREGATSLQATALYRIDEASVVTPEDAFYASAAAVAGSFFQTLGSTPLIGRVFSETEAQASEGVAVVSEGFWRRVLGAPTSLEGREIVVDGRRLAVVGVIAHREVFPDGVDIWLPHRYRAGTGGLRNNINYRAVARLASGATVEQARAELAGVARGIREADPVALYSWGVGVRPLREAVVGGARGNLVMLTAAVVFLLLVACANLAGLSLARVRKHAPETAVHLALGAGRGRLLRRAVVEHVALALAGGGLGVVLAWWSSDLLARRAAAVLPRANEVGFDARIAALGIGVALVAGLLAGVVPAVLGSRGDLSQGLRGGRGGIAGGRGLPGAVLVGAEVALAVSLLVSGGLLLRSFRTVMDRELGFDPAGVVTADVALVGPRYADASTRHLFWESALERVRGQTGVAFAAVTSTAPTYDGSNGFIEIDGYDPTTIGAEYRVVGRGYFEVLGVPLEAGRSFAASDDTGSERVVLVNRAMADRYWPAVDPVGERVRALSQEAYRFGGEAPWLRVIGVVGDIRHYGHEADVGPEMYVLHDQIPEWDRGLTLLARASTGGSSDLADRVRRTLREVDPSVAVEVGSLATRVERLGEERRLVMGGVGLFATAALLLVCLGVYGLMAFAAGERSREMAVRVALGADRRGIVGLMLGGALRVVLAGVSVGLVAAYGFTRLLGGVLVGVGRADPVSYAGAALLLAAVALTAALLPSLRAGRADPLAALREQP